MGSSNNDYKPGDRVQVQRGDGWLDGTVLTTILARCHIQLDDCERVVVDDYHEIRRTP